MPAIVVLNVSETVAPAPNNRQGRCAILSQGATTLPQGTYQLLNTAGALTAILKAAAGMSNITWAGGTVTVTTTAAIPGQEDGDTFQTTVAGVEPAAYNGLVEATVTGPNSFTFPLAANPGAQTQLGTYTMPNQAEVIAAVNTWFSQLKMASVYVLELGAGDGSTGPTALQAFIAATAPPFFYAYAVPRSWDGEANFNALLALTQAPNGLTYYIVPTTLETYTNASYAKKNVVPLVEAPGLPLTEFDAAAFAEVFVAQNPSSTNKVTPYDNSYLFGVTDYPLQGNGTVLAELAAANINVVGTGAEGGIDNDLISGGTTGDGNDASWWYNADWCQINLDLNVANTVINGSNNPQDPLYYNQPGIDRLQNSAVATLQTGTTYGVVNGTIVRTELDADTFAQNVADGLYAGQNVVNAEPFLINAEENPDDYAAGIYRGLSCAVIPQRGFKQIIINLNVSNLISAP